MSRAWRFFAVLVVNALTPPPPARFLPAVAAALMLTAPAGAAMRASAADAPAQVVDRLHQALIEAMKIGEEGGYARRKAAVEDVAMGSYDFPLVARLVLGEHWGQLTVEQRDRFLEVFQRLVVANYAGEFSSYNGHEFHPAEAQERQPGVAVVPARMTTGSGETRHFAYQVRKKGERWLIVNVAVDGVSDLALKRSQYTTVVQRDGFDALIERLEKKIRDFESGRNDDE